LMPAVTQSQYMTQHVEMKNFILRRPKSVVILIQDDLEHWKSSRAASLVIHTSTIRQQMGISVVRFVNTSPIYSNLHWFEDIQPLFMDDKDVSPRLVDFLLAPNCNHSIWLCTLPYLRESRQPVLRTKVQTMIQTLKPWMVGLGLFAIFGIYLRSRSNLFKMQ
jgi:hypothetical protein